MNFRAPFFALVILLLSGCNLMPKAKETAKPGEVANLNTAMGDAKKATGKADAAADKVTDQTAKRDGELLADINAAAAANEGNPTGVPKEKVDAHLDVAKSRLTGTQEDPEARAAAAERDRLFEAGKAAEARAATDKAVRDAEAKASALAVAKAEAAQAIIDRDAAQEAARLATEELARKLEQNRKDNQAAIDTAIAAARDAERKSALRKLSFALLGLGIVCALVAGATMYLTKGKEWQRAAIAAGCAACFFAMNWTLNQPWFKYLAWGCGGAIVLAVCWFLWRESKQADEIRTKETRVKEADEAEETLKRIIGAVDALGDTATVSDVRARMSSLMNDSHKALILELKAETKRTASIPVTTP